jgi:hypothetical protein
MSVCRNACRLPALVVSPFACNRAPALGVSRVGNARFGNAAAMPFAAMVRGSWMASNNATQTLVTPAIARNFKEP